MPVSEKEFRMLVALAFFTRLKWDYFVSYGSMAED